MPPLEWFPDEHGLVFQTFERWKIIHWCHPSLWWTNLQSSQNGPVSLFSLFQGRIVFNLIFINFINWIYVFIVFRFEFFYSLIDIFSVRFRLPLLDRVDFFLSLSIFGSVKNLILRYSNYLLLDPEPDSSYYHIRISPYKFSMRHYL